VETKQAGSGYPAGGGDILALGSGTAAAMWVAGYVARIPPAPAPAAVAGVALIALLLLGGFLTGRLASRGWRGGAAVGALVSLLNMPILAGLLAGPHSNRVAPSALLWIPGSILMSAAVGAAGAAAGARCLHPQRDRIEWTPVFARVAAVAALCLVAIGGEVTSRGAGLAVTDWPDSSGRNMFLYPLDRMAGGVFYLHAHRLFGFFVCLTSVALAWHLYRVESRRWVRMVALATLAAIVVQGLLGGLHVTGRFTMSLSPEDIAPNTALALVHGILGQIVPGLFVAIAVFTSATWRGHEAAVHRRSAAAGRLLALLLLALLLAQLILGAALRHPAWGLHLHVATAAAALFLSLLQGALSMARADEPAPIRRSALALALLAGIQTALGLGALMARNAQGAASSGTAVFIRTAHQAFGAVVFAVAVLFTLWNWRLLAPTPRQGRSPDHPPEVRYGF
jgi:heme A synthase